MRDVTTELKELRLHGMASAWTDLMAQGTTSTESSRWLIEHLLQAETTDRAMRSVSHQMNAAKFPVHRDLAGFDFDSSKVDQSLVRQLATLSFTDTAQNAVLIGGPGTGKTHLAPTLLCQFHLSFCVELTQLLGTPGNLSVFCFQRLLGQLDRTSNYCGRKSVFKQRSSYCSSLRRVAALNQ